MTLETASAAAFVLPALSASVRDTSVTTPLLRRIPTRPHAVDMHLIRCECFHRCLPFSIRNLNTNYLMRNRNVRLRYQNMPCTQMDMQTFNNPAMKPAAQIQRAGMLHLPSPRHLSVHSVPTSTDNRCNNKKNRLTLHSSVFDSPISVGKQECFLY